MALSGTCTGITNEHLLREKVAQTTILEISRRRQANTLSQKETAQRKLIRNYRLHVCNTIDYELNVRSQRFEVHLWIESPMRHKEYYRSIIQRSS